MVKIYIALILVVFCFCNVQAENKIKQKSWTWNGFNLKIIETLSNSSSGGEHCTVTVSKGSKIISEYDFKRISAVGGSPDICSYSIPEENNDYWFIRFKGDYKFPYLIIDKTGMKYFFNYMPSLYIIDNAKFMFGVYASELDVMSELSLFDIKKDGQFHVFKSELLKKYFTFEDWKYEVFQNGKTIYLKIISNKKIFGINTSTRKVELINKIPSDSTKMKKFLPDFHLL